jgi:basic membrane lipoprotein Med (substrate-binding protein (PBP1-ABC) superfamily)
VLRLRTIAACAVLAIAAAALAGCGGGGSSSVSPATYVKSVCLALGPFEKDVQTRSAALQHLPAGAAQRKTALQGFFTAVVGDSDKAVSQLKAAGSPNVKNGSKIESAIVLVFTRFGTAAKQAAGKADALPTNSPTAFQTAATALNNSFSTSMSGIGAGVSGLKSPELDAAEKKEPACKSIGA